MTQINPPTHRSFRCEHCSGEIQIPFDLPPTQAPCPHCSQVITSPPPAPVPETPAPPVQESAPAVPSYGVDEPAQSISVDVHVPVPSRGADPVPPPSEPAAPPVAPPEPVAPAQASMPPQTAPPSPAGEVGAPGAGAPPPAASPGDPIAPEPVPRLQPDPNPLPGGATTAMPEAPAASPAEPAQPKPSAPARKRRLVHPVIPFVVAILAVVGVLVGLVLWKKQNVTDVPVVDLGTEDTPPPKGVDEIQQRRYLRDGWKTDTSASLAGFLKAETLAKKAEFVIGGRNRLEEMRNFYGQDKVDESDTPLESFSHFDLDLADKERGLFLMRYERPAQYDIREFFRPVATLEVQKNLEEPGLLLSAFASRTNFAMEPVRVMAFFKRVNGRLLLDWDVYRQTKYRSLRHFVAYPERGKSQVFRVIASEDRPPIENDFTKVRYYRFSDPAHATDHTVVPVAVSSRAGQILQAVAWVQTGEMAQNRYATVELAWSDEEEPRILLRQVVCWEFLGLGGMVGNAQPVPAPDPAGAEPEPGPSQGTPRTTETARTP